MHKVWHNYFVCCVFILLLAGCASTRVTDTAVIEHQRQLDEYKSTVDSFVRRADECAGELERIRERAGRRADEHTEEINHVRGRADILTREIDKVIKLFDDYQQAVERLLQEYNRFRNRLENSDKDSSDTGSSSASADTYEGSGVHNVLQGN